MARAIKIALALAIGFSALCYFYAPARLAAIVALGRSPLCPYSQAMKSADERKTQVADKDRIAKLNKLLEKDPAGYQLWQTPHGQFWIPEGRDDTLSYQLAEQERKIYGIGERDVQSGDIVLDCGANVGVYTHEALNAGAQLVVAIEPAPEKIECLRRNFVEEIAGGRVILYGSPAAAVDKLVAELKLERVDFIRMDLDGAEQRTLQGAGETLKKYHPRMALAAASEAEKMLETVRSAWPGYTMECGPCTEAGGRIRPDVLYFH